MKKAFGADLSLNHGAVIIVEMTDEGKVDHIESMYKWDAKDSHKLTIKSTPKEILAKVIGICRSVTWLGRMHSYTSRIAIDWAVQSVYWRTKKQFVVQMGLFMGMLYAIGKQEKIDLLFVTPQTLRKFFIVSPKMPKLEFQKHVLIKFPPTLIFETWANEDDVDAYILALYAILTRDNNDKD